MTPLFLILSLLLCVVSNIAKVHAQQFQGSFINNSLPNVGGSEVAFFNILDAKSRNTTLINYSSLSSSYARLSPSNIKRVIIFVHGLGRNPQTYIGDMLSALDLVTQNQSAISRDSVQILCPYFTNGDDKGFGYPWNASAPAGGYGSYTNVLVWPGSQWIGGTYVIVFVSITSTLT